MRVSRDITVSDESSPRPVEDDIFGIARYLADSVSDGQITLADGAHALAEWADTAILDHVAAHLAPGSEAEHLVHAAAEWRAA